MAGSIAGAVAGPLVGGLLGSMGGDSSGSTTSTTAPWGPQQQYILDSFKNSQNLYNKYQANPSQLLTAPQTGMQTTANNMAQGVVGGYNPSLYSGALNNSFGAAGNLAMNGGSVNGNNAASGLQSFANGSMLNNPYMQGMANAAANGITRNYQTAVAPQITSQMEGSGRYGSGAMMNAQSQAQQDLATQLGNSQNNLFGQMYQTNMGNQLAASNSLNNSMTGANIANQQAQLSAIGMMPNLQGSVWSGLSGLNQLGTQLQGYNQSVNQSPLALQQAYMNLIGGQQFGSQSTNPYFTNPASGAMGGALLGSQLVKNLGFGGGGGSGSSSGFAGSSGGSPSDMGSINLPSFA